MPEAAGQGAAYSKGVRTPAVLCALHLAGCQLLFPFEDRFQSGGDATADGEIGDSVVPPDTNASCSSSPSAFDAWTFAEITYAYNGPGGIDSFAFYRMDAEVRSIATNTDAIFDVDPAGDATQLTTLDPPSAALLGTARATPDGSMLWYLQTGIAAGVYFATRASGWIKQPANLGFLNAERIEPGGPAFFSGSVRMVVAVGEVGEESRLFEVSSIDGRSWTELDTIKFAGSSLGEHNPVLSSDGCLLVFTASDGTNQLRVSAREPDGSFMTTISLANVSALTSAPSSPVITPDRDALWFASNVGGDITRYRGTPP